MQFSFIQYIEKIIALFRKEPSFSSTTFLMIWRRDFVIQNFQNATDDLVRIGFYDTMLELAFEVIKCEEYKKFMSSLYLYILKNRQKSKLFNRTLLV